MSTQPAQWNNDETIRGNSPEGFLWKSALEICSKLTGEHPYRSAISTVEITLQYRCSAVNLQCIFEKPFNKNIYGGDCFWIEVIWKIW